MRAQMTALDLVSHNLANVNTTGFKEGRAFFTLLNQTLNNPDSSRLDAVINNQVVLAEGALNESDGSLVATNRDLDVALTGNGYLTVQTPRGLRYTRDGSLVIGKEDILRTRDGYAALGEDGPIQLGPGKVRIDEQGGVYLNGNLVGRLKLVGFSDPRALQREGSSLMAPAGDKVQASPAKPEVRQGYLEQSNVNAVASVVGMIGILRHFEAIQKSVNLLMNDVNAKAIDRLGR
jgi:flagellar basal-body rod protein FlgF